MSHLIFTSIRVISIQLISFGFYIKHQGKKNKNMVHVNDLNKSQQVQRRDHVLYKH